MFKFLENGYMCEFYDTLLECTIAYNFLKLAFVEIHHNGEVLAIDDSFLCDVVDYNSSIMFKDYEDGDYCHYFAAGSFSTLTEGKEYCVIYKGMD